MPSHALLEKFKTLPASSGVYFHKSASGEVIYVGKAAVLKNRVRQYFQNSRNRDPKTEALVLEITDTDWIETQSEIDALFLEAEMIRRYMPRYNILLRDDKSLSYVRIDHKSEVPTVAFTRRPLDDGAEYIGPFVNGWAVRRALKYLRRVFPYFSKQSSVNSYQLKSKLPEQIGLEPKVSSPEEIKQYKANLKMLAKYMRGEKVDLTKQLEREMKLAAREQRFEEAAYYRNRLSTMKGLGKQIIFSDREFLDLSKDEGLNGLASLLGLQKPPRRIEGFDISHMSGTDTVASMVVFEQGMPNKAAYRKFKMRLPGNDDFAHMREVITRRLSEKHVKDWGLPELFLIDGGKGQLAAALEARETLINNTITHLKVNPSTQNNRDKTTFQGLSLEFSQVPMIGLAKKEEEIVIKKQDESLGIDEEQLILKARAMRALVRETEDFIMIGLPHESHIVKLLQRIRDESHRFAVSYHSTLKRSRQTRSWLEEVPGIGPTLKKKLIKEFGSARGVEQARDFELDKILGEKRASILKQYMRANRRGYTEVDEV